MLDGNKYLEAIIETWNEAHKGTKLVLAHAVDRLEGTLELCESCAGARATSVTEINSAARAFPDHFERGAAASKRILKELLEEKTSRTSRPSFATTMEEDEDEDEGWAKAKAAQKELSILQCVPFHRPADLSSLLYVPISTTLTDLSNLQRVPISAAKVWTDAKHVFVDVTGVRKSVT
eukprot:gene12453-14716_t